MSASTTAAPATAGTEPTERRFDLTDLPIHLGLLAIGLLVSMPIFIAIFTSFKTPADVVNFPPTILPETWTLQNYSTAWNLTPMGRYLINSAVQTGLITLLQVVFSVLAAFAFAFLDFKGKNLVFGLIIGSLMIPFELTFIPNFLLVSELGWANTYTGLVIPFAASAFGVFMLRQFFLGLPRELWDAARVDGASSWTFLWRVLVPLSRGGIGAFAIFAFLGAWNQYLWPLVITNDELMRTTQIGIRFFLFDQERGADWGAIMASSVIVMAPTLVAFLVAQKQIVRGISMSGLKG